MDPKMSDLNTEMSKCVSGGDPLLLTITYYILLTKMAMQLMCTYLHHSLVLWAGRGHAEVNLLMRLKCRWGIVQRKFNKAKTFLSATTFQIIITQNCTTALTCCSLFTCELRLSASGCFCPINQEFVWVTVKKLLAEYSFKPFVMSQRAVMPHWCLSQETEG